MLLSRYKFSQASSDGSIIIALVPKVKENIRIVTKSGVQNSITYTKLYGYIFFL